MAKHPPRRRPKSEDSLKHPRHRLAEIQAEIHDVQQQIEQLRRAARVIRDAQDVRAWERQITDLTDRLSGLLLAEAMQRASDHPENIQKARSLTQGAGLAPVLRVVEGGLRRFGQQKSRQLGGQGRDRVLPGFEVFGGADHTALTAFGFDLLLDVPDFGADLRETIPRVLRGRL